MSNGIVSLISKKIILLADNLFPTKDEVKEWFGLRALAPRFAWDEGFSHYLLY